MALITTDDRRVALIDSVTDRPVPGLRVFGDVEQVEDFIAWLTASWEKLNTDHPRLRGRVYPDPGKNLPQANAVLFDLWREERIDPETGDLKGTE